jgi:GntR family transcriptional repressor for pyruvate dehydrogenase complex
MGNSVQPVSRVPLSEQVASRIVEMIKSGQLKSGERLPSEAELCRSYQVGRSTVREALRSLSFIGIVKMKAGEGSFVTEGPSAFLDRVLHHGLLNSDREVNELAEARALIESELAALSSQLATEDDLRCMADLIAAMERCVETGEGDLLQLDMEFHFTIARASQNNILCQLLRTIRNLLTEYISRSQALPGSAAAGLKGHRKIFEAIGRRDSRQARSAMRNHLLAFSRGYALLVKASEGIVVEV